MVLGHVGRDYCKKSVGIFGPSVLASFPQRL